MHAYTGFHSPPNSSPIQAAIWHWAELPVLCSRSLLVLHDKYSRLSMSIPDYLTIPSPTLPPGNHKAITEYWADFPVLDSRSLLVLHFKYNRVHVYPKLTDLSSPWEKKVCFLGLLVPFCFVSSSFVSFLCRFHIYGVSYCISPSPSDLVSLSMTISRPIDVAADGVISFFVMASNIACCVCAKLPYPFSCWCMFELFPCLCRCE